ncbi:MAG TPA: DUF4388 domain-containing protein [Roseiflexaceae bacterium]|nr:DUF4388 domain-containing protein [Roseiflexaceae bacterium]
MQLDGNLNKFPLREVIEMVVYSSVTGVLELRAGADIGQIFFRDGQPYHAAAGERIGMDAIAAMFEERDSPFRFVADRDTEASTLWLDPWDLIDRGETQARQWSRIRAFMPNLECVPALRGAPSANQIHISETVWPVLSAVDGRRNVVEIADYLNLVLLDACVALADLIEQGLIEIRRPPVVPEGSLFGPPAARKAPAQPEAETRSTAGFLERLLAEAQAEEQRRPDLTDDDAQDRKRVSRYVDDRR